MAVFSAEDVRQIGSVRAKKRKPTLNSLSTDSVPYAIYVCTYVHTYSYRIVDDLLNLRIILHFEVDDDLPCLDWLLFVCQDQNVRQQQKSETLFCCMPVCQTQIDSWFLK